MFSGNPAAVCPLQEWPEEALMQAIAAENNLSETAFFVRQGNHQENSFALRWFTPAIEVDLCGHATLAAAHVLFTELDYKEATIVFVTRSGELTVQKNGDMLTMSFPKLDYEPCDPPAALLKGLGKTP